jgi:hypothetical protein
MLKDTIEDLNKVNQEKQEEYVEVGSINARHKLYAQEGNLFRHII